MGGVSEERAAIEPERRLSLTIAPVDGLPRLGGGDESLDRRRDVDGGWAWVVLASSFLSLFLICGLGYNIGIFFVSFLETFDESKSYTAWIGAVYSAVFQIAGPISSLLLPRLGARRMMVLGGIVMAVGFGMLFFANSVLYVLLSYSILAGIGGLFAASGTVAATVQYFERRLYVACGIMSSGGGIGIMAVGLLAEYLIVECGWRGAALLLGGLSLQICVCGALVFDGGRRPSSGGTRRRATNWTFFRDARFWFLNGSIAGMNMASSTVFVFFKDVLLDAGLGGVFQWFIACVGIGSTVGRGVAGFLTGRLDPTLYYFSTGTVCAVDVFVLSVVHAEGAAIAVASLFGLCHGTMAVLQTIQIAHVFGLDDMPILWGYGMGFGSVGVLIGPPLGGLIYDESGSYAGTIALVSALFFASGFFSLLVYVACKCRRKTPPTATDIPEILPIRRPDGG